MGYVTVMGFQPQVQPMFVSSTYRIKHSIGHEEPMLVSSIFSMTGLRYPYGGTTVSAAYVCNLYVQNQWLTLHPWVFNLKCSLCLLALRTESLGQTILIGALPWVLPLLVRSTFTNTRLHYTYGCPTLSKAYDCKVLLQNKWVGVHLWARYTYGVQP